MVIKRLDDHNAVLWDMRKCPICGAGETECTPAECSKQMELELEPSTLRHGE
jgi:hypothetical protein